MEKFHPWIEGQRKHPSWSRKRGIKGIARYASEKNLKRVAAKCLGYQRNRFKKKREREKKKRGREREEKKIKDRRGKEQRWREVEKKRQK